MFYTKFIFNTQPETQRQAPGTAPDLTTRAGRSADKVRRREALNQRRLTAAQRHKQNKTDLLKKWKENNPNNRYEVKDEGDLEKRAFLDIKKLKIAKEVHLLVTLAKKHIPSIDIGTEYTKALAEGKKKNDENAILVHFRELFSVNQGKAEGAIGIYYLSPKDKNKYGWAKKRAEGWYVSLGDNSDSAPDKPLGSQYLSDVATGASAQIKSASNSIAREVLEQVSGTIKKAGAKGAELASLKIKRTSSALLKWVKDAKSWKQLDEKVVNSMVVLYGPDAKQYLYRYVPGKNGAKARVYYIKIDGQTPGGSGGPAGYIEIDKSNKFGKRNAFASADKLKSELLDNMKPGDVQSELIRERTRSGEAMTKVQNLETTAGMAKTSKPIPVEFSKRGQSLTKIEKSIVDKLKASGIKPEKATELAALRRKDLEAKILAVVEANPDMKSRLDSKPLTKVKISIDENDKVTVVFKDGNLAGRLRKASDKVKDKVEKAKNSVEAKMNEIKAKVNKMFGKKMGPIIFQIFAPILKIKDWLGGKASIFTSAVLGYLGIKKGVSLLKRTKKFDQAKMDAFVKAMKKDTETFDKKDLTFSKATRLKGVKLVVKNKKGLIPGAKFRVKVGSSTVDANPVAKETKDKWVLKDKVFEVADGTIIPAGTVFPKGTQVVKTKKS